MRKLDNDVNELIKYSKNKINNILLNQEKQKFCVISAIFGKSDLIHYLIKNFINQDNYTFIFTDDKNIADLKFDNSKFQIIFVPQYLRLKNPRLTAKIFKIFIPLICENSFESAFWVDANLLISDFKIIFNYFEKKCKQDDILILFNHPRKSRNIIREIVRIFIFRKDSFSNLIKAFYYIFKNLLKNNNLKIFFKKIFWGGFIYFKKLDKEISYFWWEFVKISIRDQIFLPLIIYNIKHTSLLITDVKDNILSAEHLTYKHYDLEK